jgi:hypothetical protein
MEHTADHPQLRKPSRIGRILLALVALLVLGALIQQVLIPDAAEEEGARMALCMSNQRLAAPMNTEAQASARCREQLARQASGTR